MIEALGELSPYRLWFCLNMGFKGCVLMVYKSSGLHVTIRHKVFGLLRWERLKTTVVETWIRRRGEGRGGIERRG